MNSPIFDIVRAQEHRTMPWANGKGTTLELARSLKTGTGNDFDWRVSVATLDEPGDFSRFPGFHRTLVVIDDAIVTLDIDGKQVELSQYEKVEFEGDVPTRLVQARPQGRDLNVMCRRGSWTGMVDVGRGDEVRSKPGRDVLLWVALDGKSAVSTQTGTQKLGALDVVWSSADVEWIAQGTVALIELRRIPDAESAHG